MNDDDDTLLRSLGSVAAEQEHASELAELERLAKEDPAMQELLEAARPLDDLAQARIVNELSAHVSRPKKAARSRVAIAAGALALAAGVALFVRGAGGEGMPLYALEASGAASSRAPTAPASCALRAGPTGSFEVVARPNDALEGSIGAQAFVVRGGAVEAFTGEVEISAKGSVRITGENRSLSAASELRVVVGRAAQVTPVGALAKARASSSSGRGWQRLRCTIEQP